MTLNLTEAGAVNTVIEHLTGTFPGTVHTGRPMPDRAQTILALASLADAAYRRLSAGYSGEKALEALEAHWPGALREIWMLELHGVDGEPFATEQAARRHATTAGGWAPDDDLAWRPGLADSETGRTAKVLYANGHRTLCTIWPAPIRGLGAEAAAADVVDAPDESVATCKVCGCTEDDPCDGGCTWATGSSLEIDLCTACAWPIARDAIASGLYRLEETVGDTLFEARGGLIPQPVLTEQEIASLQPLMDAVEAANGDPEKLAEIAREHGVPRLRLPGSVRAADIDFSADPGYFWQLPPNYELFADPDKAAEALRTVNDTIAQLAERTRQTAPGGITPGAYARAFAEDLLRLIRAGAYASVFGLEWSFRSGGLSGPVMSETEARKHVTDLRRLYDEDTDRADYAVQLRLVGPWVDDIEPAETELDAKPDHDAEQQPSIHQLARQWKRDPSVVPREFAPHVVRFRNGYDSDDPDSVPTYEEAHPAECAALPPGAHCWFHEWTVTGGIDLWSFEAGIYRINLEDQIEHKSQGHHAIDSSFCVERYHLDMHTWSTYLWAGPRPQSTPDNGAFSDADQPLGERDTA